MLRDCLAGFPGWVGWVLVQLTLCSGVVVLCVLILDFVVLCGWVLVSCLFVFAWFWGLGLLFGLGVILVCMC